MKYKCSHSHQYKIGIIKYIGLTTYCSAIWELPRLCFSPKSQNHVPKMYVNHGENFIMYLTDRICRKCVDKILRNDDIDTLKTVIGLIPINGMVLPLVIDLYKFIRQPMCSLFLVRNGYSIFDFAHLDIQSCNGHMRIMIIYPAATKICYIENRYWDRIKLLYDTMITISPRLREYLDNLPPYLWMWKK